MKLILIMGLLSVSAWAGVGREAWERTDLDGKVQLLAAYEEFYAQASKAGLVDEKRTSFFQLLPKAWAAITGMDCVYAGWPSKRVGGRCSSPTTQNPDYSEGSCGAGQLQCQPLFFGPNLCTPVATQSQRNTAFSSCRQRFRSAGRTHRSVVENLIRERRGDELTELMDFAEGICNQGAQATTPMCRRLQEVIAELRAAQGGLQDVVALTATLTGTLSGVGEAASACISPPPSHALIELDAFVPVVNGPRQSVPPQPPYVPQDLSLARTAVAECATLEVGQSKVIGRAGDAWTRDPLNRLSRGSRNAMGVNPSYTLSRTGPNNYVATLSLNFNRVGGADAAAMARRARTCMQELAPRLRGPGGEILEVRLTSPHAGGALPVSELPAELRPRTLDIAVQPGRGRGRADQYYEESFDCEIISHEMMHMLGLVDEYDEEHMGAAHDPRCRVVTEPARVNLMNDLWTAHDRAGASSGSCSCDANCQALMNHSDPEVKNHFIAPRLPDLLPPTFYATTCRQGSLTEIGEWASLNPRPAPMAYQPDATVGTLTVRQTRLEMRGGRLVALQNDVTCQCPPNSHASCAATMRQAHRVMARPDNLRTRTCPQGTQSLGDVAPVSAGQEFQLREQGGVAQFSFNRVSQGASLLEPAHFARILAGPCAGQGADNYNRCGMLANALQNSAGQAIDCSRDVPAECRNPDFFLGQRQSQPPPAQGREVAGTPGGHGVPTPTRDDVATPPPGRPVNEGDARTPPADAPEPRDVADEGPQSGDPANVPEADAPETAADPFAFTRTMPELSGVRSLNRIAEFTQRPGDYTTFPARTIRALGHPSSLVDGHLFISEAASATTMSDTFDTVMILLPRRQAPTVERVAGRDQLTLPTGEMVFFEADGSLVPGGALSAPPLERRGITRRVSPVTYNGSGLSIRVDSNVAYPATVEEHGIEDGRPVVYRGDPTAEVRMGGRTCQIATGLIWEGSGNVQMKTDQEVLATINQHCRPRPQPAFTLP